MLLLSLFEFAYLIGVSYALATVWVFAVLAVFAAVERFQERRRR